MYRLVKCPICNKMFKTRGTKYFRCYNCQVAYDIEKCLVTESEEKRYRKDDGTVWIEVEDE